MLTQPTATAVEPITEEMARISERSSLGVYSDVLQVRDDTIRTLLASRHGIARIFDMFLIVTLIAGLGVFFGLPAAMRQPTLPETLDLATGAIRDAGDLITDTVLPTIASGRIFDLPRAIAGSVQGRLNEATAAIGGLVAGATTQGERVEDLLSQAEAVTEDQITRAVAQSPVTPEQLGALLSKANLTDAQVDALLSRTLISRAQLDEARKQTGVAIDAAMAKLQPVLDSAKMTPEQLKGILEKLELTPQQLDVLLQRFAATPDQLAGT